MSLLISEIMDDLTLETQKDLDFENGTGDELALMVSWLNHTQQDLLHTGIFKHLLRAWTSVQTAANTESFTLSVNDVRRVDAVYDRTNGQFLTPLETVFAPVSLASPEDKPRAAKPPFDTAAFRASGLSPQFYWISTAISSGTAYTKIYLLPTPESDHTGVLWVYYTKVAPTIATATDNGNLIIGQDGRDALFAGIASRAFAYLDHPDKATYWRKIYESAKMGEQIS